MENAFNYAQNYQKKGRSWDIHRVIKHKNKRFPRFFAEKRYKLINFAPKKGIVDKVAEQLIMRKKESTVYTLQFMVYS